MMRTLAFPFFRPSYAIAACSVALAATCAYQAPGMMQAILVVGANAQLPLERLATEAGKPTPVSATDVSTPWKERVPPRARPAMQKLDSFGEPVRDRHAHRDIHGYQRNVTDYKYWT
ncbi:MULTISPECIES: hypothetical protein [Paraburkholderia]|jgi:hypothetical protein|nr:MULTISPECIES: hypothetical protein [Paraburkholderia]BEU26661.1 hypothetical protein PBP221_68010 [Paraburkholderia sp. 22B1P]GJH05387.1 hypothetical protein CBA19C8_32540 [Paraburkholderia terrae]CAG9261527.1 conserved exported hypothetical protein [Paraburkholderia caribensis]